MDTSHPRLHPPRVFGGLNLVAGVQTIAILEDPAVAPLPSYTATDVRRALEKAGIAFCIVDMNTLAGLDRSVSDVLVLPYLDGDLSGAPLEGMLRFHRQGGGLVFLGDTPHVGRSFPYRNSQAPELRLTRCRDPLQIRGLTQMGRAILGDLPDWERMLGRQTTGVRTSAFPPDECHNLLVCDAGFKLLSPVVLIERKHPSFLGARVAVAGFDGGEPRENLMGVCNLPWTFDPGLLTREWAGADRMVAALVRAVVPPSVAVSIDFRPVVPCGGNEPVRIRARNLSDSAQSASGKLSGGQHTFEIPRTVLEPAGTHTLVEAAPPVAFGGQEFAVTLAGPGGTSTARRTRFGFREEPDPPFPGFGFSTFRAFRSHAVDEAFRDFVQSVAPLGMKYVRMALSWEDLEPRPGTYHWDVPDQLLELAASVGLPAILWVFPTARGSGLGDGGVPEWVLREPAIDRHGKAGNFPSLWSPFYRNHYFAFLTALAKRYATDPRLLRFVFDFGNSDFPYTYHYYGDRGDLFDYSPHEAGAFRTWLRSRGFSLSELGVRWGRSFFCFEEVPVPLSEQSEAWVLYDEFRVWGLHQGIKEAAAIVCKHAPLKVPPDFPGHGLGAISDISTYAHHAQSVHWEEASLQPPALTEAHNMGPQWGGEAWQVGARFADYDEGLFQSVRLGAHYLTIPGPDLGVWEEDIGRVAMIRRTLAGFRRSRPRVAIIDRMAWSDSRSLAQIGARLDQPVDLLTRTCRHDFSCYDLLVLPPDEMVHSPRGTSSLLPLDEAYYHDLLEAIRRGLKVLLFPRTGIGDPQNPLLRILRLTNIAFGPRCPRTVNFPPSWGGGVGSGMAASIFSDRDDRPLLVDQSGEAITIFRPEGAGGLILAGYDPEEDSFDGTLTITESPDFRRHTLSRLLTHLGIGADTLATGQANLQKELLFGSRQNCLTIFNNHVRRFPLRAEVQCGASPAGAFELATGRLVPLLPGEKPGWRILETTLEPLRGHYFLIDPSGS